MKVCGPPWSGLGRWGPKTSTKRFQTSTAPKPRLNGCSRLDIWLDARVVKCNPDRPQRPIRQRALEEGKVLYMAVPRLRKRQCFLQLDPAVLETSPGRASTIAGAFRHGRLVTIDEMLPVDLVVSGSVAVNRRGTRIGKGGGFADLEYALAATAGIVRRNTPVITTVHRSQVLEEELPSTPPLTYAWTTY